MLLFLLLLLLQSAVFVVCAIHETIGSGAFLGFLADGWRGDSVNVQLMHTSMQRIGHLIVHGSKHHGMMVIHHGGMMIHLHRIGHSGRWRSSLTRRAIIGWLHPHVVVTGP